MTTPWVSKGSARSAHSSGSGSKSSFRKDPIPLCNTCFTYHDGSIVVSQALSEELS